MTMFKDAVMGAVVVIAIMFTAIGAAHLLLSVVSFLSVGWVVA